MSIFDMEPVNWTMGRVDFRKMGVGSRTRFPRGVATAMLAFGGAHGGSRQSFDTLISRLFRDDVSRRPEAVPASTNFASRCHLRANTEDEGPGHDLRLSLRASLSLPFGVAARQLGSL